MSILGDTNIIIEDAERAAIEELHERLRTGLQFVGIYSKESINNLPHINTLSEGAICICSDDNKMYVIHDGSPIEISTI